MSVFRISRSPWYYAFAVVVYSLSLSSYSPAANAFFSRTYSTLEESQSLNGDFDDILRLGKLRILVPQDFTSVTYLPRRRSPLAEQQRIAVAFAQSHGLTRIALS